MKVSIIKAAEEVIDSDITSVDYVNVENQLTSEIECIYIVATQIIHCLLAS